MTDEEKLKAALGALRDADRKDVPPFDPMWKAASERARVPRKLSRARLAMITSGVAAAACIALFVQTSQRSAAPPAVSTAASPAAAAQRASDTTPAVQATMTATATVAATAAPTASVATAVARWNERPPPLALDFLLRDESDLAAITSFDLDPRF